MMVKFLFLIFLIASPLERNESCSSSQNDYNKFFPELDSSLEKEKILLTPDYDLAVIGGGPQAVAVLAQLALSLLPSPLRLMIIETKSTFGVGLPFDKKVETFEHLLNTFSAQLVAISGDADEFLEWLHKNPMSSGTLHQNLYGSVPSLPPRILIGRYLKARFHYYVKQCQKKDYKIDLKSGTTAQNISLDHSGFFAITLSTGIEVQARDVFLATGHWYRGRFDHPPKGYFESPWPAWKLEKEIPATLIAIFGTSLSAIDAVVTLVHKFGKFKKDDTIYELFRKSKNFNITMYSRSGELPMITEYGRRTNVIYTPVYVTDQNIMHLIQQNYFSAFQIILKLLKMDLVELLPSIARKDEIDQLKNKDFFSRLDNASPYLNNPLKRFMDDTENKIDANEIKLCSLYLTAHAQFEKFRLHFTGEEAFIFKEYLSARMLKCFSRVPMKNAKKLLALMNSGRLNLVAVGSNSNVTKKQDGQGVRLEYGGREPIDHDYFIDATGQNGYIARDPSSLTKSLLHSGLAQQRRILYKVQRDAELVYHAGSELSFIENIDPRRTEKFGDYFFYIGDGVEMELDKMRVIPRPDVSPIGNMYASAPFSFGYFPAVQDLQTAMKYARAAVAHMMRVRGIVPSVVGSG